jgi:DNA polymerase-3 subunit beta
MTNTITISVSQARGLILASAKQDVRYYLNGSLFDFENGRAVSTDGHCLLAINVQADFVDPAYSTAIARRDDLETIAKLGKVDDIITVTYDERGITYERDGRATLTALAIDGRFPEYARVIPDKWSNEQALYDPELVARASKALKLALDSKDAKPELAQNGKAAALITVCGMGDKAIAVVMPWRPSERFAPLRELGDFNAAKAFAVKKSEAA